MSDGSRDAQTPIDNSDFWAKHTLEDLARGKKPLESIDELRLPWLVGEEWEAFDRAVRE